MTDAVLGAVFIVVDGKELGDAVKYLATRGKAVRSLAVDGTRLVSKTVVDELRAGGFPQVAESLCDWVGDARGATIARNASLQSVPGLSADEAVTKSLGATRAALRQAPDVVDASLGNSQYLAHFSEDYDWLVNTFEWRSYLERIDPPAGASESSWYQSPDALLRFEDDGDPLFDTQVDHILNHTRPVVRIDANPHGVFTTSNPMETLDDIYRQRAGQTVEVDVPIQSGYTIPAQPADITKTYQTEPCSRLILRRGNSVVTAFPWPTC